ncbi:hypothetical protein B0H14DRAFT_3579464 [Mycena olivaceomarginata]|nr:hypothetical protein B0H14DRAFT_3579464 [Mycena olivaceomarginata]
MPNSRRGVYCTSVYEGNEPPDRDTPNDFQQRNRTGRYRDRCPTGQPRVTEAHRGYLGELSHALEVSFVTHLQPLQFLQRGLSLDALPALLKIAVKSMSDSDREVFRKAWLEHLIGAAVAAGAKVPIRGDKRKVVAAPAGAEEQSAKKSKSVIINVDSDTDSDAPMAAPSMPPAPAATMLQFPKATKGDVQRYWKNVVEQGADKRKEKAEQKERDAEKKKERERDQGRE